MRRIPHKGCVTPTSQPYSRIDQSTTFRRHSRGNWDWRERQTPPLIIPTYTGAALGEGVFSYKLEITSKSGCALRKVGTV
jgi:hypothetical protein